MCGILAIYGPKLSKTDIDYQLKKIIHRGPDDSRIYRGTFANIGFVRLAIMDVLNGNQPFKHDDMVLVANGEIYNFQELKNKYFSDAVFDTNSDCEILIHLYRLFGFEFMKKVDVKGMFAFVIYDNASREIVYGRDFMGIIPLYSGYDKWGNLNIGSEFKTMNNCTNLNLVKPGEIKKIGWNSETLTYQYYDKKWFNDQSYIPQHPIKTNEHFQELRNTFIKAVETHMMADVNLGVLLSGGLDSSLVASIVNKKLKRDGEPKLKTFSIGLEGAPDLLAAEKVAKYLDTDHTGFTYTISEGLSVIKDVIYHIETYDTTTIRASIPMYIMARKIKSFGIKTVLSGEGADEMFGGYLYFHKAPNAVEFQKELVEKMKKLHYYDNVRANKSMLAWGVETRVPFQDLDMVNFTMEIDPNDKMCDNRIQKYILRKAFDTAEERYLPKDILWRQKEQFSDGVGYQWIDSLKELACNSVSDYQMTKAESIYPRNTPNTKEEFMYRMMFETMFNSSSHDLVNFEKSIACSTSSALKWEKLKDKTYDPSGLCVDDHITSNNKN